MIRRIDSPSVAKTQTSNATLEASSDTWQLPLGETIRSHLTISPAAALQVPNAHAATPNRELEDIENRVYVGTVRDATVIYSALNKMLINADANSVVGNRVVAILQSLKMQNAWDPLLAFPLLVQAIQKSHPVVLRWLWDNGVTPATLDAHDIVAYAFEQGAIWAVELEEGRGQSYAGFMHVADFLLTQGMKLPAILDDLWTARRALACGCYAIAGLRLQSSTPNPWTALIFYEAVHISRQSAGVDVLLRHRHISEESAEMLRAAIAAKPLPRIPEQGIATSTHQARFFGGSAVQDIYRAWFNESVAELIPDIVAGVPFWEIADRAATMRYHIACRLDHLPSECFGSARDEGGGCNLYTPLRKYPESKRAAENLLSAVPPTDNGARIHIFQLPVPSTDEPTRKLDLTTLVLHSDTSTSRSMWIHTAPESFAELRPILAKLFDKARAPRDFDADTHIARVCDDVAKWHWLFAHMAPYERGSAAIGELLMTALLASQKIIAGEATCAEGRDTVALTTECAEFVALYPTLFKSLTL